MIASLSQEMKLARRCRADSSTSMVSTALAEVAEQHRLELDELRAKLVELSAEIRYRKGRRRRKKVATGKRAQSAPGGGKATAGSTENHATGGAPGDPGAALFASTTK